MSPHYPLAQAGLEGGGLEGDADMGALACYTRVRLSAAECPRSSTADLQPGARKTEPKYGGGGACLLSPQILPG